MSTSPVRLYIAPRRTGSAETIRLLASVSGGGGTLFKNVPKDFSVTSFTETDNPADADFFIAPQAVKSFTAEVTEYIAGITADAARYGKNVILFLKGDYSYRVHVPFTNVIAFKGSEFGRNIRDNEAVFATFVEDLGEEGIHVRGKSVKPSVSFCGYAGFKTAKSYIKYLASNLFLDLRGRSEYKRGIYFRKRAMDVLSRDVRLTKNFIVRNFFSGNLTTAAQSPEVLRREYIDSIRESDFVLCPKGDANYSSRFYETLSLGRFPVLIDTDMVLPFEKRIDYSRIIVRVPHTDIARTGDYIMRFYDGLSEDEFKARQQEARDVFRNHLRFDAYFNEALPLLRNGGIEALR